ncbi:MAG: transporter permease [Oerskovia sp.]|nr:transporter permease [Oerskovia sp.]
MRAVAASAVRLRSVVAAELDKLRTLPVTVLAVVGTVVVGALIAAAQAAAAADQGLATSAVDVTLRTVPFVVAGLVLVGVLAVSQEHAGRQVATTLAAVPRRGLLVAGKSIAATGVVALAATSTLGACMAAATVTRLLLDAPSSTDGAGAGAGALVGAAAYLVLIGVFSHAVALVVRHLVPALVGVLALVLVVSPLLAGATEHARWLPDRAAAAWFDAGPGALDGPTATLVALAGVVVVGGLGSWRFLVRDA